MSYEAPVDDILFALKTAADFSGEMDKGGSHGLDEDTLRAILEEAGKFAGEQLAPLNKAGDRTPSRWANGHVVTPMGWKEAYGAFREAGWSALPCPEQYGGQALPETVAMAVCEMWNAANLSFGLCPLLTQGAIDALHAGGSDKLKKDYLPRMVSGEWTGTMNLTEPHAGSDLSVITTRAERHEDGTYRIFGTKIFITYGDHDLTENIIHLVLARLPDAPSGTRGISLFLVPKRLVNADGSLGAENDVVCAGLEHKLGIHGSPTAVMKFGEKGGAIGYLVGQENRGLNTMFIMMNAARLAVGIQGVAVAERATQHAVSYAKERRQGRTATSAGMVAIAEHPDVRRNLLTMKALTRAARAICYATAADIDRARHAATEADRRAASDRAALLTPVAKAFSTDIGCEVASIGVQVHGGMGFIEETGAAQYYRDARILPIYEGTNGIQAIDLVTRKLPLAGGNLIKQVIAEFEATARQLKTLNRLEIGRMGQRLSSTVVAFAEATAWMLEAIEHSPNLALAGATPYLRLFGLAAGGHYLAKGALAGLEVGGPHAMESVALARFFAENISVAGPGLASVVTSGGHSVIGAIPESELA
ncbi:MULTISPECIES: acyl-CoA dehydrogenase [Hyphomicrobium]|jgi:alkylation response protein AidB-like acyl-CoA dehydrogenase|uniref:acyl-CoA dehydrogenase n=1 Tax=Hyphomicrobium TaxID=81 RepID=UPI00037FCDC3|nr:MULTISPECIES: acyl-CoA dehydrogenase [Hyphomicrobium]WBT37868.1 acyl-CoA dehydrogenase [Hyphomicrobium sp. DMF-1]